MTDQIAPTETDPGPAAEATELRAAAARSLTEENDRLRTVLKLAGERIKSAEMELGRIKGAALPEMVAEIAPRIERYQHLCVGLQWCDTLIARARGFDSQIIRERWAHRTEAAYRAGSAVMAAVEYYIEEEIQPYRLNARAALQQLERQMAADLSTLLDAVRALTGEIAKLQFGFCSGAENCGHCHIERLTEELDEALHAGFEAATNLDACTAHCNRLQAENEALKLRISRASYAVETSDWAAVERALDPASDAGASQ